MLEKTFNPSETEPRIYEQWEAGGAFKPSGADDTFSIVIPPPNVTGSLHIGHALNNTLQDVLVRFERMRGKAVLWLPGTDHAGIATQMVVERELAKEGLDRRDMGREAFLERVWQWKAQSGGTISQQLKRLGASCDWSRERFTLDDDLQVAVRRAFVRLYEDGLIYRAKRLVNWDPHFQTAISDLEVEQIEKRGKFKWSRDDQDDDGNPVAFDAETYNKIIDREPHGHMYTIRYQIYHEEQDKEEYIEVSTTRPETILGDVAIAVHPENERWKHLVGKKAILPLFDMDIAEFSLRTIPIIKDEYADPEKGTGAVKITPAHDFNDAVVGKRHGLEFRSVFDQQARIMAESEEYNAEGELRKTYPLPQNYWGLSRYEARKAIVASLYVQGYLLSIEPSTQQVPHGDRSGVAIEPLLTDQWFVDAETLAKPALAAVEDGTMRFSPDNWKNTYFDWLRNIEPWCISRQLWWGHRIPAWFGPDREYFSERNFEYDRSAPKRKVYFVGEEFDTAKKEEISLEEYYTSGFVLCETMEEYLSVLQDYLRSKGNTKAPLSQDPDVLDTWFSSALWPFSTMGWPDEDAEDFKRFYPTSTLITGFDIIFFWVARMMMMGLKFTDQVPFDRVIINALVRDEKGQKMSKSKGNVLDPLDLVDQYGADALRLTLTAMSGQARDIKLSTQRIEGYRNFGTKLWNAARFCQMNECVRQEGFDPKSPQDILNRWIIGELAKTTQTATRALDEGQFSDAAQALYHFVWHVFCDWYLELSKPILNEGAPDLQAETRATTAWVLDEVLKLLHPIQPFLTEELWDKLAEFGPERPSMLITTAWPQWGEELVDSEAEAEIDWIIRLITEVRSIRAEMNVPQSARPDLSLVGAEACSQDRVQRRKDLLVWLGRLGAVRLADSAPDGTALFPLDEATCALGIMDFIDIEAERSRLEKDQTRLRQEVQKTQAKLQDPKFTSRAPQAVVEEHHQRLADHSRDLAKVEAALKRLPQTA